MAVTKIRKISSWTLLVCFILSIVVLGLFFGGGVVDPAAENKDYVNTNLLLNWTYLMFVITLVVMLAFAVVKFIAGLKTNPKSALRSFVVLILFAILLIVTYSMGDATPIKSLNADSQTYNIPFWLKVTDMWLYSSVVLFALIVLAIIWGQIRKMRQR
jgi:heme/copper-type cytochrome/quinol oxidase subunit 2